MKGFDRLPFEIIHQILTEYVNQLDIEWQVNEMTASEPYLEKSSYTELIKLRFVSKTWSKAIIQFYFETILIYEGKRTKVILDNWRGLFGPDLRCPVKRLTIEELWDSEVKNPTERSTSPSMNQLARIIKLLGVNLKRLKITFRSGMRISPHLMEAIKTIRDLKSLSLTFSFCRSYGTRGPRSLSELFSLLPNLEHLIIHCDSLGRLDLKPPALSKLRYFSFTYDNHLEGIHDIIQASKQTLKFIAFDTDLRHPPSLRPLLEPIKDTLEGIFSNYINNQLEKSVTDLDFPHLRVIATQGLNYPITSRINWLQVPMFKNVRTIVAESISAEYQWHDTLRVVDAKAFKTIPNFKHMVFTKNDEECEIQEVDPKVCGALKSHGIQSHLTDELTPVEILELDLELNGPIK